VLALLLAMPARADPLPMDRRTDWTYSGVPGGIPHRTRICATFAPGASASAINQAIAACSASGGGVVYLGPGIYEIVGIHLYRDHVTLRGAGADQTVLKGCNVIRLGNGANNSSNIRIVGGGTKDSHTFLVETKHGLSVEKMIEIDRADEEDFVTSTVGGQRNVRQLNVITSVHDNVVSVRNPLIWDFNTGDPRIKWTFTNTKFSGVEDLKLDHAGTSGCDNFALQYCYGCWLKGVHSHRPAGYHIVILATLNGEIRDSYIADAQTYGANNGGLVFYGSAKYGSNSSWKVENNIFDRVFPGVELQNSSSGFYVGYNYGHATMASATAGPATYMFMDNHGPHDMMNLWEGNVGEMFGSDGYFGGSSHGTLLRNHFTGHNPIFDSRDDPVRLNRLSYYYNVIGNVLGSSHLRPRKYQEDKENCVGGAAIYRLGYPNIGNCSLQDVTGHAVPGNPAYPDAKVGSTLLRWGNYDYFSKVARFSESEIPRGVAVPSSREIPPSYYYSSRPAWWPFGRPWPPIGPDLKDGDGDISGHAHKIPAQMCWEARGLSMGGAFNASVCYDPSGHETRNFRALP
jgi:hypothetical protein